MSVGIEPGTALVFDGVNQANGQRGIGWHPGRNAFDNDVIRPGGVELPDFEQTRSPRVARMRKMTVSVG